MYRIALLGAGRIAKVHVESIVGHARTELACVVDVDRAAAESMAGAHGARVVDAGTRTRGPGRWPPSSSRLPRLRMRTTSKPAQRRASTSSARSPSTSTARGCARAWRTSRDRGAKLFVAFNRRFDPHFRHLKSELDAGAIGRLEQLSITSRDPGPPPGDYIRASGGLFRDMTIHDFDLARYLLGEEPVELWASASTLVSDEIAALGDIDSAVVGMRTASGKLAVITNSRRAAYGYDQRIEAHGSEGILSAGNVPESTLVHGGVHGFTSQKAMHFFLERYSLAYRAEWDHFVDVLDGKAEPSPTGLDGARALAMGGRRLRVVGDRPAYPARVGLSRGHRPCPVPGAGCQVPGAGIRPRQPRTIAGHRPFIPHSVRW